MSDSTPNQPSKRRLERTREGVVTSDKRQNTRTVVLDRQIKHAKYGKYLKRTSTVHVHDAENASNTGDRVEIVNCRPISKTKSWRLVRVLKKAEVSHVDTAL